jgi:amidase
VDRDQPWADDAPLVARLRESGAVLLGKTTTPEFGWKGLCDSPLTGITRNPWSLAHTTGGSSGGAAAAVVCGMGQLASGSDGGGSIRIPASCCGVFGLKPSRGRMVGTRGDNRPLSLSVSHVHTRTVRDSAAMFAAIEDAAPGSRHPPVGLVTAPLRRRLRVGLVVDGGTGKAPSAEVRAATESAAALMRQLGHAVIPTAWPMGREFINDFLLLWAEGAAEFADAIAGFAGRPVDADLLEPFSLGLVRMWKNAPPAAPREAFARLQKAAQAYDPWFASNRFDVVMSPVLAWAPPPLGAVGPTVPFDTLIERLTEYVGYTTYHNVAGAPAMSVPLHWTDSGLPVGTQFAARTGGEGLLFQLAYQLEAARPWAHKAPPIRA